MACIDSRPRSKRFRGVSTWFVLSLFVVPACWVTAEELPRVAEATGPRAEDRMIAGKVRDLVTSLHIAQRPFDDQLSERGFDHFLKSLDPRKEFFLKSDIDEFMPFREKLDDNLKRNDIGFAYVVYKRLLERIHQIVPEIQKMIDMPHDFTVDESIVTDRKSMEYSTSFEESQERWRKQIKFSLLVLKADEKTDEQAREQLHRRFRTIEKYRKDMDVYELLELFLSSMTESLDPHTNYMAPRAQDNFKIQLGLKLDGIGAQLKSEDGLTVISSTVPGGAADKDGRLKPGDQIVGVGQEGSPEIVDVVDMKLDDVVSLIRGAAGTKVRLSVQPKLGKETVIYEITRAKIELMDSGPR